MNEIINIVRLRQPGEIDDPLTDVLKTGARQLLARAVELEAEVSRDRLVRHGHGPERSIQTGIGPVAVSRVSDNETLRRGARPRRWRGRDGHPVRLVDPAVVGAAHQKSRCFGTGFVSPRRLDGRLPGGAWRVAGQGRANLSPTVVTRLTGEWEQEYGRWQTRDLSAQRYVYVWADGVYLQARMEDQSECMLVWIARPVNPQLHSVVECHQRLCGGVRTYRRQGDPRRRSASDPRADLQAHLEARE